MGDVLVAVLVTFVIVLAVVALSVAYGVRRLHRHNRVSRRFRTRAPLRWLVSPGQCARLHRRLRDSVHVLHATVPARSRRRPLPAGIDRLADAADELEAHAAALDGDLLVAARLRGSAGAQLRSRLRSQVDDVERVTARLAAAATAASPQRPAARPSPEALAQLDEQLDALLEAARDELARLEAGVGLPPQPAEPLAVPPRAAIRSGR